MIEQGAATEAEMIIAFLRAEVNSPRYFATHIAPCCEGMGLSPTELITNGDVRNEYENDLRRRILGLYRGYGRNAVLFQWFPTDVVWRRVLIEPQDHGRLLFADKTGWVALSDGTRLVRRLAEKIALGQAPPDPADRVTAIQQALCAGTIYPELIAVQANGDKSLVLVEGHSRATAYVGLKWSKNIEMILGFSPEMRSWFYY